MNMKEIGMIVANTVVFYAVAPMLNGIDEVTFMGYAVVATLIQTYANLAVMELYERHNAKSVIA